MSKTLKTLPIGRRLLCNVWFTDIDLFSVTYLRVGHRLSTTPPSAKLLTLSAAPWLGTGWACYVLSKKPILSCRSCHLKELTSKESTTSCVNRFHLSMTLSLKRNPIQLIIVCYLLDLIKNSWNASGRSAKPFWYFINFNQICSISALFFEWMN